MSRRPTKAHDAPLRSSPTPENESTSVVPASATAQNETGTRDSETRNVARADADRALPPSPDAGESIPADVKRAWWWRGLLAFWCFWNLVVTGAAVIAAVNGEWSDFGGFFISAVGLWLGFFIALGGWVPPDFGG